MNSEAVSEVVSFCVTPDEKVQLSVRADTEGRSLSNLCRYFIRQALEQHPSHQ